MKIPNNFHITFFFDQDQISFYQWSVSWHVSINLIGIFFKLKHKLFKPKYSSAQRRTLAQIGSIVTNDPQYFYAK
jgi:hypothetical protein